MDGTVIAVSAIGACSSLASAALGAFASYKWGKQALALKDQQLEQLQKLTNETIAAKDAQLDQLTQLTTPRLLEHFRSQRSLYEDLLADAQREVEAKDAALQASGQLGNEERSKLEQQLVLSRGELDALKTRLAASEEAVAEIEALAEPISNPIAERSRRFRENDRVEHAMFGLGVVKKSTLTADDEELVVRFDDGRVKILSGGQANLAKLAVAMPQRKVSSSSESHRPNHERSAR